MQKLKKEPINFEYNEGGANRKNYSNTDSMQKDTGHLSALHLLSALFFKSLRLHHKSMVIKFTC